LFFLSARDVVRFEGLTGGLRFGADHGRVDPSRLYVIAGEDIKPL
jgi:hypothetical protein